jgi:hypothetical protein
MPLAVDLDVLKLGTLEDPVERTDVERALYALTGWQKPQRLVDAALDVIDSYATGVRAGRVVPAQMGHTTVTVACDREHLDEHLCPITVKTVVETPPLAPVTREDTRALVKAAVETVQEGEPVRKVAFRNVATMTPAEILAADPSTLTQAQLNAHSVLVSKEQRCSACALVKALTEFYRDKARLTGHASRCKDCANAATSARREKPPRVPL